MTFPYGLRHREKRGCPPRQEEGGKALPPESGLLGINPLGDELNLAYDAARSVNEKQLMLYYGIGKYISMNSREGFWGKGAIDAISERLEKELPGLKGFSARNLRNMRSFYEEWVTLDASLSIDQLNLADASAKTDEETSLQIWQTHVPNSYEFPMDDFLHIGFSHHTLILSKVKDMNPSFQK